MPVDPQIQKILDLVATLPPMHTLSVTEARERMEKRPAEGLRIAPVAHVADRLIVRPGGSLPLRIYTPIGTGPFPIITFFHGSGFVVCSLDTHDAICRNLCGGSDAVVVSVDYRLAPEHKFPAAPDDCLFATRWIAEHAAELGGDAARIVVAGDSAGGNLAAVTALRIRDEGGPKLAGQLLIYPVTDYHAPGTPSYAENAEGYGLSRAGMAWFWHHYLADPKDAMHPHASPLRAENLAGLPPTLVYSAEYDVLRDEAEMYAHKLRQAGVAVREQRWEGVNHGFFFWVGIVDTAGVAMDEACAWLKSVFGSNR
ncbi:MAG: alpha/beta hydrolase [Acetobacteraceae bacterium]|nr:alpha/beta hydrolase [Acetobacteraceae bacterium]